MFLLLRYWTDLLGKMSIELCRTNQDWFEIVWECGLAIHYSGILQVKNSSKSGRSDSEDRRFKPIKWRRYIYIYIGAKTLTNKRYRELHMYTFNASTIFHQPYSFRHNFTKKKRYIIYNLKSWTYSKRNLCWRTAFVTLACFTLYIK
jgi:hypothetical protein